MSQAMESESFSAQSLRRREALSAHLKRLEGSRRRGVDLRKTLDGIELDGWELDQLARGLDQSGNAWQELIVEGVALRNKLASDLAATVGNGALRSQGVAEFEEMLVHNAALGLALLEETQNAVNQLVLAGEMGEAKKLTSFRNKIGQSVQELKARVGEGGFSVAQGMSEEFVTPTSAASWTRRAGGSIRERKAGSDNWTREDEDKLAAYAAGEEAINKSRSTRAATGPVEVQTEQVSASRMKPLLMILAVSVAVWAVIILPRLAVKQLPVLEMSDMTPRSEIREVVARPPSLFVDLDTQKWQSLSTDARLALIDDVGQTAADAGYHGVRFTTGDGRTAARWLKERGSELVD